VGVFLLKYFENRQGSNLKNLKNLFCRVFLGFLGSVGVGIFIIVSTAIEI